jgi:uncharacterized membrane protein SpoIIM required for sporulation
MTLNITDPAILFPGISLLFLAYTNRYLAIAKIIRELNVYIDKNFDGEFDNNREEQIQSLLARVTLIRYMQLFGILAFIFCIFSISALLFNQVTLGFISFGGSMLSMFISLCVAFMEVWKSGSGLRIEIERTHPKKAQNKS